jgi:hypothetical protein
VLSNDGVLAETILRADSSPKGGIELVPKATVSPGFKGQSRVHLIHAPKKTTYIIIECT